MAVRSDDAVPFEGFAKRIQQFQDFRRELVRRGIEISPAAGREWGDNDANRSVRKALNKDIEALAELYAKRSQRVYAAIDNGIDRSALLISLIAAAALLLAGGGAVMIARAVARPLARITRITEAVAAGDTKQRRALPRARRRGRRARPLDRGVPGRRCGRTRS